MALNFDPEDISEDHAEFIFQRMYQCDDEEKEDEYTTSSSQNGMGIGLFLCHQIIELHGGTLDFSSNAEKGSTFTFTLHTESKA
mgnify:CR=1 FL=1